MIAAPLAEKRRREIAAACLRFNWNLTRIAVELKLHRDTVRRYAPPRPSLSAPAKAVPCTPEAIESAAGTDRVFRESGDDAFIAYTTSKRIKTEQEALDHGEVDRAVWRVDSMQITSWEVGIKLREFTQEEKPSVRGEKLVVTPLWRVQLKLKRIFTKTLHDATDLVFERLEKHAPRYPVIKSRKLKQAQHLLEIDLSDAHFGKMAWAPESGADYDLKIAEKVFSNAVEDLLERSSSYSVERIVLPIGSDFFHIDSPKNATTSGTVVDTDGRYPKIIATGELAVIAAIERLVQVAPVEVLWIPGNHDHQASYHMSRTVAAWFRRCKQVRVNNDPMTRKYLRYYACLLGYTHGEKIAPRDLPGVMAQERPVDWGETTCREWRRGHEHRARQHVTTPVETYKSVVVRTMRALSFTDAWHYGHGFVGCQTAAECYLFHRVEGCVGNFVAPTRVC